MPHSLPTSLWLKHRIATSPLAASFTALREAAGRLRLLYRPELGLLHAEQAMMDGCLRRMVKQDWNCLDVGAHIGSVSYKLSMLAPRGTLVIVEPVPAKAAALQVRFPLATVHQVAVGETLGEVTFYENLERPGFSSLSDRITRGKTRALPVRMIRIDDLWPQDQKLRLIKIDVEGHEFSALRGAERTLRQNRPVLLFEAGAVSDPDVAGCDYDGLFDYLRKLGYDIRPVYSQFHGGEPITLSEFNACRRYPFTAFNFFATQG